MPADERDIQDISSILGGVFDVLHTAEAQKADVTAAAWRKILLSIKSSTNPNEGANLAAHSRVVDLKNGVLLVEADHPGWIELLQLRKHYILRGLSMYARNMDIRALAFRMAGKRGTVTGASYSTEEARGLAETRLAHEEAALAQAGRCGGAAAASSSSSSSPTKTDAVPDGLREVLSALKRDMGA